MILLSFSLSSWFAKKLEFGVLPKINVEVSHISIFVRIAQEQNELDSRQKPWEKNHKIF